MSNTLINLVSGYVTTVNLKLGQYNITATNPVCIRKNRLGHYYRISTNNGYNLILINLTFASDLTLGYKGYNPIYLGIEENEQVWDMTDNYLSSTEEEE